MRNQGCSGGCLTFIAGIVLIGLVLLAVKWFGIPVGLALAVFSFIQFQRSESDVEGFEKTAERLGMQSEHLRWGFIAGMVIGVFLVISSTILWFVPTDDTARSREDAATERAERADPTHGGTYLEGPGGINMCDQPGMAGAQIRNRQYACRNAASQMD